MQQAVGLCPPNFSRFFFSLSLCVSLLLSYVPCRWRNETGKFEFYIKFLMAPRNEERERERDMQLISILKNFVPSVVSFVVVLPFKVGGREELLRNVMHENDRLTRHPKFSSLFFLLFHASLSLLFYYFFLSWCVDNDGYQGKVRGPKSLISLADNTCVKIKKKGNGTSKPGESVRRTRCSKEREKISFLTDEAIKKEVFIEVSPFVL